MNLGRAGSGLVIVYLIDCPQQLRVRLSRIGIERDQWARELVKLKQKFTED
jgi:hypothetical protein